MNNKKGELNIFSWNVNGIRAVVKKGFLDWYNEEKPDILCLQETRVELEKFPTQLFEDDSHKIFLASAQKKGYSGVSVITRIKANIIVTGMGEERFDNEGRIISAEYDDFILHSVYFPNGNASQERLDYKMDFYDFFLKKVEKELKEGKNVIICGDVNTAHKEIDLARPKENSKVSGFLPQERQWIDKLLAAGFDDAFRLFNEESEQYTWWDQKTRARDRNVGWRIDYFFTNRGFRDRILDCRHHPMVLGSDHCPVSLKIKV